MDIKEAIQRVDESVWPWLADGPGPEDGNQARDLEALQTLLDVARLIEENGELPTKAPESHR